MFSYRTKLNVNVDRARCVTTRSIATWVPGYHDRAAGHAGSSALPANWATDSGIEYL